MRRSRRAVVVGVGATLAAGAGWLSLARASSPAAPAATPIEHLVVIFDENVSFDHYFGTYPNAANPAGEPPFTADAGTPAVHGLTNALLHGNPNGVDPQRIDRANALTCDQDHDYLAEQEAFDDGAMDKFVQFTSGGAGCAPPRRGDIVMDYYDGNTVTALWNLAQHFAMSDEFYGTTFGPSTPGALNLIAGTTHGASPEMPGAIENGTMIADPDPAPDLDDCARPVGGARMSGTNIGDLLSGAGVSWGWFQGGFRPSSVLAGHATCASAHRNVGGGAALIDYSPHHEPFMYYASTANPHHLAPSSTAAIGHDDQAHHQYDLLDFDAAVHAGNLPQVSFLKPASFEDGHAGYSDPLDEQRFIARTLDELQQSPDWGSTAVVIAYDDSDGWYDHEQMVSQQSDTGRDAAICKRAAPAAGDYRGRCGPGPRLPLLVISPWVHADAVDHTPLEQASIIRFIEDNWLGHARIGNQSFDARATSLAGLFDFVSPARTDRVYLDPATGEVIPGPPGDLGASPDYPPPVPTPTPTGPGTFPTPTPTVTPPPPQRFRPKVAVRLKRSGPRLTLNLTVSHVDPARGRITLSVKLRGFGKTFTSHGFHRVRSGRVKIVLRAKHRLKQGRYTLTVRIRQGAANAKVTRRLTVR
jgi:phospholipase C